MRAHVFIVLFLLVLPLGCESSSRDPDGTSVRRQAVTTLPPIQVDPMPPGLEPLPPETNGRTLPEQPANPAFEALQQRYLQAVAAQAPQWEAQGMSLEERERLQMLLKRSILGD